MLVPFHVPLLEADDRGTMPTTFSGIVHKGTLTLSNHLYELPQSLPLPLTVVGSTSLHLPRFAMVTASVKSVRQKG